VNIPVYLDEKVQLQAARLAREKGTDLSTIVNEMLRSDLRVPSGASLDEMTLGGRR
jgi:hypothetical protein